jgi:hypothetical protein
MARFSVDCETCSFTAEASSVTAALSEERAHRREQGVDHRVTIERRPRGRERPPVRHDRNRTTTDRSTDR